MTSKIASGAIAHPTAQLTQVGKEGLLPFLFKRVGVIREQAGSPPLVTPTALYATDQSTSDILYFETEVHKELKTQGISKGDSGYKDEFYRLMMDKVHNDGGGHMTENWASLYRGDFGPTLYSPNVDIQNQVMLNFIKRQLSKEPYHTYSDYDLNRISDAVFRCANGIILSIKDGKGVTYSEYLRIKRKEVSVEDLMAYIQTVPDLVFMYNTGILAIDHFENALREGLFSIGNCADWIPDGMDDALKIVEEKLALGWTLPSGSTKNRMAILIAMYGEAVYETFEHHENRELFSLSKESLPKEEAVNSDIATSDTVDSGVNVMRSPMPGAISSVLVQVGDKVEKGQTIAVLYAMKMETPICAEVSGVVEWIVTQERTS